MVTLLIIRGFPGSGKSTLAKKYVEENEGWVRVNRDDLRFMMFGKYSDLGPDNEDLVTIAQKKMVKALLDAGISVVADDTNLSSRAISMWVSIWDDTDCEMELVDVLTDVETCVERDAARAEKGERAVGKDVIYYFGQRYPIPWQRF